MDDYKELCELVLKQITVRVPPTNNLDDFEEADTRMMKISDMSDEQIKWALQNMCKDNTTYDSRVKSLIALVKHLNQFINNHNDNTTFTPISSVIRN